MTNPEIHKQQHRARPSPGPEEEQWTQTISGYNPLKSMFSSNWLLSVMTRQPAAKAKRCTGNNIVRVPPPRGVLLTPSRTCPLYVNGYV